MFEQIREEFVLVGQTGNAGTPRNGRAKEEGLHDRVMSDYGSERTRTAPKRTHETCPTNRPSSDPYRFARTLPRHLEFSFPTLSAVRSADAADSYCQSAKHLTD